MKEDVLEKITILYEDDNLVAIDKPSGLIVHSDGKTIEPTVSEWALLRYPGIEQVGEPWTSPTGEIIPRPGIVHRIDRETSGVLLICKNQPTFELMKQKFKERHVEKAYYAFVYGEMKETYGIINRPIARSRKDFRMWSAQRGARGEEREAITEFAVLERGNGFSFVEVRPKTGRTHQIRVHFKAINYPIICDKLYAPKREAELGFTRLALHAVRISFEFEGKEKITIEAPMPDDFKRALTNLSFVSGY